MKNAIIVIVIIILIILGFIFLKGDEEATVTDEVTTETEVMETGDEAVKGATTDEVMEEGDTTEEEPAA